MNLVICMAGLNERFHNVGFDVPKALLPWEDKTVLNAIIKNLTQDYKFKKIYLIPNQRDRSFLPDLLKQVEEFGITKDDIFYVPDTRGQADTAALACQLIIENGGSDSESIVFHNADTILLNRNCQIIAESLKINDAYMDVFPSSSPAYSYVTLEAHKVTNIVEKQVISPFACSGLYAFKTIKQYVSIYNQLAASHSLENGGEFYISDVLKQFLNQELNVAGSIVDREMGTLVLGTPVEYGIEVTKNMIRSR